MLVTSLAALDKKLIYQSLCGKQELQIANICSCIRSRSMSVRFRTPFFRMCY